MKKFFTMLVVAATALTASAQNVNNIYGKDKFTDNWYIGINAGVASKTTNQAILKNINPDFGLRLGKWFTPSVGMALEGNVLTSNKALGTEMTTKTFIRTMQAHLLTTFNLTNAFLGYPGSPRPFEVIALAGLGYSKNYGNPKLQAIEENCSGFQAMTNKLALDFAYNFGKKKEWQLYLEPALIYSISGSQNGDPDYDGFAVQWDANSSNLQLNLGINYYFKTSNGTHHFTLVDVCDPDELAALNNTVNQLRNKSAEDADKIAKLQDEIIRLKKALKDCEEKPAEPALEVNVPPVFYKCDKWDITKEMAQNVAIAAQVLINHPELKLQIKGYASPEGPAKRNDKLSIKRALAVKNMLVKDFGIDPDRLSTEACGTTDKLFKIYELNRVAMLFIEK